MTDRDNKRDFNYRKSVENKFGKYSTIILPLLKLTRRTGVYIRKSDIPKGNDGLQNPDDYFEMNTDKVSVATTEDLESSIISDVDVGKLEYNL